MKSNDEIPADEMLLAEAIAAAKARDLGWCKETPFADANGYGCLSDKAVTCCALGALHFAGRADMNSRLYYSRGRLADVSEGNDLDGEWQPTKTDRGGSLGWAFRCAMTEES